MIKKIGYNVLLLLMLLSVSGICFAQSKDELNSQINKLKTEIGTSQKLLKEISSNREITVKEIELREAQINKRNELIAAYKKQLNSIDENIKSYNNDKSELDKQLTKSRQYLADLLVIKYRNSNNLDNLLFVFASDSYNQAVGRVRYIRDFNESIKQTIADIENTNSEIGDLIDKSEAEKVKYENLLKEQKSQKAELEKNKNELKTKNAELKKKESSVRKEIDKKQKESKALEAKVNKLIKDEIAKRKADATVDAQLSTNFVNNKGKLPWPVANGIVTNKYGNKQHPTQAKVIVSNNGIDISTDRGAKALCVFNGQVTTVFNTGSTNVVMVRHGLYFTLYSNLDVVYVNIGDNVKTGDALGLIHTGTDDNLTVLHFELWNDKKHINPEVWLK